MVFFLKIIYFYLLFELQNDLLEKMREVRLTRHPPSDEKHKRYPT